MHKVVAGVVVTGVLATIALGARQQLPSRGDRGDRGDPGDQRPEGSWTAVERALPRRAARPAPTRPPAPVLHAPTGSVAAAVSAPAGSVTAPTPAHPVSAAERPTDGQQSADAILRRAAAAYGRVRSMSASFVQVTRNPLLGGTTTSRGMLYQRRPDRFLMRFTQPAGDVLVGDGRYFWVYYPSVDAKQVIRTPAAAGGQAVDLQAQFLGDPGKRFVATLQGREPVAGRQAYVLRLVPRGSEPFKELKVWVDPTDYVARRFEITEENGSTRRLDLSGVRVNVPLADSLFRFTPPAGAHVVERG